MNFSRTDPFQGAVPPTVALARTPLTGVVVQIKFPTVLSITKPEFVADFQELVREDYPLHSLERNALLDLSQESPRQEILQHWRFLDADLHWRLSLTTDFVSLETRAYKSRSEFIRRTRRVIKALSATINPHYVTRMGVRYVDRIHGADLEKLPQYVRPEILGLYTGDHRNNVERTLSEIVGKTDVGSLILRCGYLPPDHTHEKDLMPAIAVPSWFLDTDVYVNFLPHRDFRSADIEEQVKALAARAYAIFRWAVNDEFLLVCGGEV